MDAGAVITNLETNEKLFYRNLLIAIN